MLQLRHYRVTLTTVFGGLVQPKNIYDFDLVDGDFIGFINGWFRIGHIYSIEARHVIGYKSEVINVNIQEATKKALQQKRGIARKTWIPPRRVIIPTNTIACLIVMLPKEKDGLVPRWEPNASDLMTNDWIVEG